MPIYPNIYQTLLPGPIVELRGYLAACGLRGRLYAYLNCNGPTGTARDELAEGMLALALARGALTPGQPIVEAVSGPFATALTLAGQTAGHPVVLVMPEDAPAMRQESLLRLGAQILHTPAQAGPAGARAEAEAKAAEKGWFYMDWLRSDDNPTYHRRVTGPALVRSIAREGSSIVDSIVIGVGSGGTITGVGETVKAWTNDVRIVAVEPYESQALSGGLTGPHGIPDIGFGLVPGNYNAYVVDNIAAVTTADAAGPAHRCHPGLPQRRRSPPCSSAAHRQRHQPLGAGGVQRTTEHLISIFIKRKREGRMTKDMTTGAITPLLVDFTVPLVLGNLFQLTYNAADSIIVGKFVGEDALAAVGTSNPLMTLAILFINGLCLGAGILVSTAYGAGDTQRVERQVSTTAIAGTVFSLVFSALCVLLATPLLRLMQVPTEILPIAVQYLRIVFAGLIFTFFYNFLAATMRALGDSKSALYFLMISSVLNIGGDLFFVEVLGWGSEGCALSTVLSEALCCVLCVIYIQCRIPVLQLGRRWLVFDGSLLRSTVQYGWTSAMQQATVQLGKIAVQAIVNTLGVNAMAAFTAASRVDDFTYMPQQNIAHAMTTLMAQNHGAGKKERVRQGFFCGLRIELVYGLLLMAVCLLFARPIIPLFVDDPAVIELGVRFLRCASLFYLMPGVTNGIQGGFRGLGDLKVTLTSSMLNMGFRVLAAAILILLLKVELRFLPVSYGIGWLSMLIYELPLLIRYLKEDKL